MKDWLVNEQNGVYFLTEPLVGFEQLYMDVRSKEDRVHEDSFVKQLPVVPKNHPHSGEWQKRAWTLDRFRNYLSTKKPVRILEIGCGNGWLTQQIAPYAENVYGLDVGQHELEQAARCSTQNSVYYLCCSDWNRLPNAYFDIIFFAGSLQYFELNAAFWNTLSTLLSDKGEIHILDTAFYESTEASNAKNRSQAYFEKLGTGEASTYYHHHAWEDLPDNAEKMYTPGMLNKVFRNRSPFPWIRVQKLL